MTVVISLLKASENCFNSFLADEDKVGDQVVASLVVNGEEFNGLGDDREEAIEDLRERVNAHYNAQKHIAKVEIDKAIGQYFFE
jgi:flagellar hook-associated protein FlgK